MKQWKIDLCLGYKSISLGEVDTKEKYLKELLKEYFVIYVTH